MNSPERKSRKHFESLIKGFFKLIGPKSKISSKGLMFYKFEDDLYFNEYYFNGGFILKQFFLDDISKYQKGVNISTSYELFTYICKIMYNKIKSRVDVIDDTLDVYLEKEDIDYGFSEIFKKLDESNRTYKVYLLSNLVSLRNINSVEIGKVTVKILNEQITKELPQNIEKQFTSVISEALAESEYLSPEQFLQEFKGRVILEISVEGYHLNNEISKVFEDALREYKSVFSYLYVCKIFLENVESDKYIFNTEDIETFQYGIHSKFPQIYYMCDKNQPDFLKIINTKFQETELPKILFRIDKNLSEKFKERCGLDNFNKIYQNRKYDKDIGNKIKRSMDWFYKGMIEEDKTDEAIALFISLETLMSTGPEYLASHTDDLAENIAIITKNSVDDRYELKKYFKKDIYKLRNKIMHNGKEINLDDDLHKINNLRNYVVWSLMWVIKKIDVLTKNGNETKTKVLKEYFERQKLK